MIHWKTKQEMGSGFQYKEKEHKKLEYNSLEKVKPYEKNTMRTYYLIRDIWSDKQLKELREHLNDVMSERGINKRII